VQQMLDDCKNVTTALGELDLQHYAPEHGSKMAKIIETLRTLRDKEPDAKIIVFCQWEGILRQIARVLVALGQAPPLQLRGNLHVRQRIIRDFTMSTKQEHSVLLLSLEKSPTGMNLVACRHLFLVHPMYAKTEKLATAHEMQAIGRLRRQGQRRTVVVHRFVTKGTVEEEITCRRLGQDDCRSTK